MLAICEKRQFPDAVAVVADCDSSLLSTINRKLADALVDRCRFRRLYFEGENAQMFNLVASPVAQLFI